MARGRPTTGRRECFGPQPFVELIRTDGRNIKWVAQKLGVRYSHVINAGQGIIAPSPELRKRLSDFLKVPEEKLFTKEALEAKFHAHKPQFDNEA